MSSTTAATVTDQRKDAATGVRGALTGIDSTSHAPATMRSSRNFTEKFGIDTFLVAVSA